MATRGSPEDPRLLPQGESDIRPVVALPRGGLPTWAIALIVLVAGLILFAILDARRRGPSAPDVRAEPGQAIGQAAPPPLYVPQQAAPQPPLLSATPAPTAAVRAAPAPQPSPPQIVYVQEPSPNSTPPPLQEQSQPPRASTEPALVFDMGVTPVMAAAGAEGSPAAAAAGPAFLGSPASVAGSRARPGMFANPSTTVVQGTLIPAVLETALNSTRPGLARALVSRDVRGFDGSRVLVPRGSRLIGEYDSNAAPGQRRALVNWIRLIRPDGVTMAIGSPASDPLGRVGVKAKVNSHFFQRFAGAILQSALDIGVSLAANAGRGDTVVVLPGGLPAGTVPQVVQPAQITPTLQVRPGTSISIFVARDLDFTRSGNRP